jgi:hypothetical protein
MSFLQQRIHYIVKGENMSLPEISRPMNDNDICCALGENRESVFDNVDTSYHLGYKCKACNKSWFFDVDFADGKFINNGKLRTSTEFGYIWRDAVDKIISSGEHLELNNVIKAIKGENIIKSNKHDPWDEKMEEIWEKHVN